MRRLLKAPTLSIAVAIASCMVGDAEAQSLSYVYRVHTPYVSVTAGAQLGQSNKIAANQHSPVNVFAVTQIGPKDYARVNQQGGIHNTANVVQVSPGLPTIPSGF